MTSLRQSLVLTFLSTNGATAVQFLVTVILARLLTPEDIGIFSITAVMVAIAHLFRDFGVVSYLQQEKELTKDKVGSAFGVLITSSWCIAALVFCLSWPAATFYGQEGIRDVMQVLAIGFVFIPFGAVTHSLLVRDYKAKEQAYVYAAGTLAYAITAVSCAYMGLGYMSMAWANLVNILVSAVAYIPFRPDIIPWLPRFKNWRHILRFGTGATLSNSLGAINNAIPDMVLGKLSGPHDVGLMSRALSTTNLLNQVIGPTISYAVLPFLSRAHHSGEGVSIHLQRGCAYVTGLMWPAFVAMAVFAHPVVAFLYGDRWLDATPIMQILSLMFILTTPFGFMGAAYMATGRPYLATIPMLTTLLIRVVAIAWLYQGTLASFSWALVAAAAFMYPIQATLQKWHLGLPIQDFVLSQMHSLSVTLICGLTAITLLWQTQAWSSALIVLAAGLVLPTMWLMSIWFLKHPLRQELEIFVKRFPNLARRLNVE